MRITNKYNNIMSTYNYYEAVASDCYDAIKEQIESGYLTPADYTDADELAEALKERLWTDDSVTGNGSGSYFFSSYAAEEALCHNSDLLREVRNEFGEISPIDDPEGADVSIRCLLLYDGIVNAIERLEDEGLIKYQGEDEEEEDEEEEDEEDTDTTHQEETAAADDTTHQA